MIPINHSTTSTNIIIQMPPDTTNRKITIQMHPDTISINRLFCGKLMSMLNIHFRKIGRMQNTEISLLKHIFACSMHTHELSQNQHKRVYIPYSVLRVTINSFNKCYLCATCILPIQSSVYVAGPVKPLEQLTPLSSGFFREVILLVYEKET